jgi:hypothetical protein
MVRWLLNNVSTVLLIVLCTGGTIAVGLAAEWFFNRKAHEHTEGDNEMLSITFEFVGIAYAILIGFVIVSLWETQQSAHEAVSTEASALEDLALLDRGLPADDAARVEEAINKYVDVTATVEFPKLKEGREAREAHVASQDIFDTILRAEPTTDLQSTIQGSMVDSYKDFAGERNNRVDLANAKLAGELWMLVLVSSLAMVLLVAAFRSEGRWDRIATTIISATIGLVLFAMVALSYPFSGDVSVDATPFREVTETIGR